MRNPIRLATAAGLAALALAACTPGENENRADAPASAESSSTPAEPDPTTAESEGCEATFDAATDDPIMEPYVGEWVSQEQAPTDAEATSTVCIEADGAVVYETPDGVWEGHLTVGDEAAPIMVLDPTEGSGGHLVLDCHYTADEDTIGLVESGDDGRWSTYVRA
jgi:hypothetical protein